MLISLEYKKWHFNTKMDPKWRFNTKMDYKRVFKIVCVGFSKKGKDHHGYTMHVLERRSESSINDIYYEVTFK